jgi:hypothetical protein
MNVVSSPSKELQQSPAGQKPLGITEMCPGAVNAAPAVPIEGYGPPEPRDWHGTFKHGSQTAKSLTAHQDSANELCERGGRPSPKVRLNRHDIDGIETKERLDPIGISSRAEIPHHRIDDIQKTGEHQQRVSYESCYSSCENADVLRKSSTPPPPPPPVSLANVPTYQGHKLTLISHPHHPVRYHSS